MHWRVVLVVLVVWLRAAPLAAQACHYSDLRPSASAGPRFRATALAAFATYRSRVYAGEYQAYTGAFAFSHPWASAEVTLTGYRLVRNGLRDYGLGDLALSARAAVLRVDDRVAALGVGLAATLPTGDARRGFGMGHAMLMPGVWFTLQQAGVQLSVELAYGRMLGGRHAWHGAGGPVVNPMNRSEIEHGVFVSYAFWRTLFVALRSYGAVPVADALGSARQATALALGAQVGPVELAAEQHLPLVGSPFAAKTLLRVSGSF
jgi:hypothetical protein